jgi:Mrp family chromosome partitioning ATPase/capsular polysaccharide biosynthesis protein
MVPQLPQQPSSRDYLRPIVDRRWWIVGFVVFVVALTYAYFSQQPKVYEASTKILVAATGSPLDPVAAELSDRTISDQAGLLTSRDVATSVARRLGRPGQATDLAQSITGEVAPGSDVVTIVARRSQPRDAALVANAFAQAFVALRSDAARARVTKAIDETQGQLNRLPRTSATSGERSTLAESIRQLQLTRSVASGSASQVDPALAPGGPSAPHPLRSALLALALALIGAGGLAFALEALDRRPRRLEEMAPLYGLPILAVMPHSEHVAFHDDGRAAVEPRLKEPLRQLRTNIQMAALDRPFKRILVTSAIAGEGKSTVVRNLAITLREGGLRVAVVDSDLRKPTLAGLFGQEPAAGLTDVLTGGRALEDALVAVPVQVRGLDTLAQMQAVPATGNGGRNHDASDAGTIALLAAGPLPADPQSVLAADRTRLLLSDLSAQYDVVLIDSPPLLPVTDAVALASGADAVIVVGRLGRVTRDNARRLAEVLGAIPGAHPIGIVVNDAPVSEGVNYGYGYGYGYGD